MMGAGIDTIVLPRNKHKLRVLPFAGFPPSKTITFQCERCVVVVDISREALEAILLEGDRRLEHTPFSAFGTCYGR